MHALTHPHAGAATTAKKLHACHLVPSIPTHPPWILEHLHGAVAALVAMSRVNTRGRGRDAPVIAPSNVTCCHSMQNSQSAAGASLPPAHGCDAVHPARWPARGC